MNYAARTQSLQRELVSRGWDMAFVVSPESVRYFCGYHGFTQSPRALLVPAIGDAILLVVESDLRLASSITETHTEVYPLDGRGFASLVTTCRRLVEKFVKPGSRWGFEYDAVSLRWSDVIREHLPVEFADISAVLAAQRTIKAPDEVEEYRRAAILAVKAMQEAIMHLQPGFAEAAIKSAVDGTVFGKAARLWPDAIIESETNVVSGDKIDRLHAMANGRQLASGDPVFVIEGVRCNGYWANLARTIWVGDAAVGDKRIQALAVVQSALRAACASLGPDLPLSRAVVTADQALAAAGLEGRRIYPMFRGLGLSKYERPNLGDMPNPLQPGMCFCAQLYVQLDDAIVGLSDSVLITERGAELLTVDAVE